MDAEAPPVPEEEMPMAEEGTPEPAGAISIPLASLGGAEYAPGDTITLRVVTVNDDGVQAEVQAGKPQPSDDYQEPDAAIDQMAEPAGY